MTIRLLAWCVDALDPAGQARFWAGVLRGTFAPAGDGSVLLTPGEDIGFRLRFTPTGRPKTRANGMHPDLTSTSDADQAATVERALTLGARRLDIGQGPDATHVVLGDPEGNEFDVIEPGNRFLADCGFVGALACDGTRAVGTFWRDALGWPFVWDEGEETAIQAPGGGPKITWGGPPIPEKDGRNRVRFEIGVDGAADLERLFALGAARMPGGLIADPDGNEFHVVGGS